MENHSDNNQKFVGKGAIFFDILLTIGFFFFMFGLCKTHVPAETQKMQALFGAYGALSLTGVFWLALQCLRVTWVDERRRKRNKAAH